MASLNQMTLIGNLGQDPKSAQGTSGCKVVSFSVATTEKGYTKLDGSKTEDQTEWHNVVLFGKLAEIGEKYLHKGSSVFIQGKLKTRSYEDKNGIKRYITEIVGTVMQMLDSKEKSRENENKAGISEGFQASSSSEYSGKTVQEVLYGASGDHNDPDLPF